ncbi:hypothetical protein OIO90_000660 [Microbotryomycetes sp. JL221]|nr:hypothetical protein OIO90_000660 [Microbotryomycetes sp. JL221]
MSYARVKLATGHFRSHHTHLLTESLKMGLDVLHAAVCCAPIYTPSFLVSWFGSTLVDKQAPQQVVDQVEALKREKGDNIKDEELDSIVTKAYQSEQTHAILGVGCEWRKYWGHALFEDDWTQFPDPEEALPAGGNHWSNDARQWQPNSRRKDVFKHILVVSYEQEPSDFSRCISSAGGHYLQSSNLMSGVSVSTLVAEVEQYRKRHELDPEQSKVVIIAPDNLYFKYDPGESELHRPLRDAAYRLGVFKYNTPIDIYEAVLEADTTRLFGDPVPEPARAYAGQSVTGGERAPASSGVPGTHPEDTLRNPNFVGSNVDSSIMTQGSSGSIRKPTRRPPLTSRKRGFDFMSDDDDDEDDDLESSEHTSKAPHTQAIALTSGPKAPTSKAVEFLGFGQPVSPSSSVAQETQADSAATQVRRKRIVSLLSSDDDDDDDGDDNTNSTVPVGRRTKSKSQSKEDPHSRRLRIEAEDEAAAAANVAAAELARGKKSHLAAVAEDNEMTNVAGPSTRTRKRLASVALSDNDQEPAAIPVVKSKATGKTPTRGKRQRSTSVQPNESMPAQIAVTFAKPSTSKATAAAMTSKKNTSTTRKDKEQEQQALQAQQKNLLQIKTTKRKTKDGDLDAALNADFNALKIVKPVLMSMKPPERHKMSWDEIDPDAEMNRMIAEDQRRIEAGEDDREDHPDKWGGPSTQAFVVITTELARKERPAPRQDLNSDPRWAGKPNFKRFRPKNAQNGDRPPLRHRDVQLIAPDPSDFGLGAGYKKKNRGMDDELGKALSSENEDDEDDDDMRIGVGQTKLNFKPKASASKSQAAKGKGKATTKTTTARAKSKQTVPSNSDDEEDELESDELDRSNTLADDDDEMDVDSANYLKQSSTTRGKKSLAASSNKRDRIVTQKRVTQKKPPSTAVLIISDSDDDEDDNGLTFKGFGATSRR